MPVQSGGKKQGRQEADNWFVKMAGLGMWELGLTGLKVTSIGYGSSPLGNAYGYVAEEDAIASVHEAARLGIKYFDVAP